MKMVKIFSKARRNLKLSDEQLFFLMKKLRKDSFKFSGKLFEIPEFAKPYAKSNGSGITLIYHQLNLVAMFEDGKIYPPMSQQALDKSIEKHNIQVRL